MVLYALISFCLAAGVFFGGRALGRYAIEHAVYTPERIRAYEKKAFGEFIAYMNDNGIADFTDAAGIQPWFSRRSHLIVAIHNGGYAFTDTNDATLIYSSVPDAASTYELLQNEYADYWYACPVTVKGDYLRTKVVRVMYFPMYAAFRYVTFAAGIASFLVFGACLLLLVRRKTHVISREGALDGACVGNVIFKADDQAPHRQILEHREIDDAWDHHDIEPRVFRKVRQQALFALFSPGGISGLRCHRLTLLNKRYRANPEHRCRL